MSINKEFGFIYWIDYNHDEKSMLERVVKAKSIKSACKKFKSYKIFENITKIDYEVSLGNHFIDISKGFGFEYYL